MGLMVGRLEGGDVVATDEALSGGSGRTLRGDRLGFVAMNRKVRGTWREAAHSRGSKGRVCWGELAETEEISRVLRA